MPGGNSLARVRGLAGPHPGDPRGGNGILMTGDCVEVASSRPDKALNDLVREVPCTGTGWFATIARVATSGCRSTSEVPHPVLPGSKVCLSADFGGQLVRDGDCVRLPADTTTPPTKVGCAAGAYRVWGSTDTCVPATGYDEPLCVERVEE